MMGFDEIRIFLKKNIKFTIIVSVISILILLTLGWVGIITPFMDVFFVIIGVMVYCLTITMLLKFIFLKIALPDLNSEKGNKTMRIYIAGKVTMDVQENGYLNCFRKFNDAENYLQLGSDGFCNPDIYKKIKFYNPMKICKADWSWIRCMVVCLWVLVFKCDTIILLPDYKESKGALLEFKVARFFMKMIVEYDPINRFIMFTYYNK